MSDQPPEPIEDIKFENFVDYFKITYRPGMFVMEFGQTLRQPRALFVRLWTDASSAKFFSQLLQRMIKEYEEKVGKI